MNQEAISSLAVRIRTLSDSLHVPFTGGDVNERKRETQREGQLEQ